MAVAARSISFRRGHAELEPAQLAERRLRSRLGRVLAAIPLNYGSSPRVRGTRIDRPGSLVVERIIPVCAGNTDSTRRSIAPEANHPRVCGEHGTPAARPLAYDGLSTAV